MALINPEALSSHDFDVGDATDSKSFAHFLQTRCRAWVLSDSPIGTRVDDHNIYGCNVYSCGEDRKTACMITRGLGHIWSWIKVMHQCPLAREASDVVPGESNLSSKFIGPLLQPADTCPSFVEGCEVHDRAVIERLSEYLAGMWLHSDDIAFFASGDEANVNAQGTCHGEGADEDSFVHVKSGSDGEDSAVGSPAT
jgi:hypothetical protein